MKDLPFSKYIAFITPYGFVVASLYLFAFWGSFKLNILEFVGFSDLIRLSLYPIAISLVVFVPGFALSQLAIGSSLPPGCGLNTAIGRFGLKHWRILVTANIVLALAVALFMKQPEKWLIVAAILTFLSAPLSHLDILIGLIPNPSVRHTTLVLLIFFLGGAFATGKMQADKIIRGQAAYLVDIQLSGLQLEGMANELSHVGYLAGNFIFYENVTKRLVFVKGKDRGLLVLKPNPKGT